MVNRILNEFSNENTTNQVSITVPALMNEAGISGRVKIHIHKGAQMRAFCAYPAHIDCLQLIGAISRWSYLQALSLDNSSANSPDYARLYLGDTDSNQLPPGSSLGVIEALKHCPHMILLDLHSCGLNDGELDVLAVSISKLTELQHLTLSGKQLLILESDSTCDIRKSGPSA